MSFFLNVFLPIYIVSLFFGTAVSVVGVLMYGESNSRSKYRADAKYKILAIHVALSWLLFPLNILFFAFPLVKLITRWYKSLVAQADEEALQDIRRSIDKLETDFERVARLNKSAVLERQRYETVLKKHVK